MQVETRIRPSATAVATRASAATADSHTLDLVGVSHRYGAFKAVDAVDLSVAAGEIVALLGPSGCGKSTLLRIVAGFVRQSAGSVLIDGRPIDDLAPNARNVGIVFQNYALFPHMSIADNVGYGLRARGRSRREIAPRVAELLEIVQLSALRDRFPAQLSGGQQQRVALARALAVEPSVLLLDEPFSALDRSLRLDMQLELKRLQRQFGLTAILVTHDQDEAMGVADRIAVMNQGRIEQVDTPVAVYDQPASLFVSGFVGTANRLAGVASTSDGERLGVRLDLGVDCALAHRPEARRQGGTARTGFAPGTQVLLSIRPEQLLVRAEAFAGCWPVRVRLSVPLGPNIIHEVETRDGTTLKVIEARSESRETPGQSAWCGIKPGARPAVFAADTHSHTSPDEPQGGKNR